MENQYKLTTSSHILVAFDPKWHQSNMNPFYISIHFHDYLS